MGVNVYDSLSVLKKTAVKKKFSLLPMTEGVEENALVGKSYGFSREGGRLVVKYGLERVTPFSPSVVPLKAYSFEGTNFYYGEDGMLYQMTGLGSVPLKAFLHPPTSAVVPLSDKKQGILFLDGANWYLFDGQGRDVEGVRGEFACYHYERLFVWDGEKLLFSAPTEPFNFERGVQDGGHVSLPSNLGEVVAMVSFGERIHLIRERGVTVFRSFGDEKNFKAVDEKFPCQGVIGSTVCLMGESIVFAAEGGVYSYDGAVKKLASFPIEGKEACVEDGRYLLSALYQGEKCLFIYDGDWTVFRLDAVSLSPFGFAVGDRWLKIVEGEGSEPVERVWESGLSLFASSSKRKMLRKLSLEGRGQVSVCLFSERGKRSYTATLPDLFETSLRAKRFGVRIVAHGTVEIDWMEVTFLDY